MRKRYKTNEYVQGNRGVCHQWWYSNGSLVNQYDLPFGGTFTQRLDEETMLDYPQGDRKSIKVVVHQKKKIVLNEIGNDTLIQGTNRYDTVGPNAHWNVWGPYGDLNHGNVHIDWSKSEATLVRETQKAFYDNNEVDSLLNIVESPELVTSLSPLHRKIMGVKVIDRSLSKRDIRKLFRNAKGSLGLLSGGFLYYTFGVAPLVNDMRKISDAVLSYRKTLQRALRNQGTESTVRRRAMGVMSNQLDPINNSLPGGWGTGPLDGTSSHWHVVNNVDVQPEMICTIRGTRDHAYKTQLFTALNGLAGRFGSSGPASYVWERIPFSFVLDWFVDLSGILNSLDNSLTGNRKGIRDICVSSRWSTIATVIKHQRNATETDSHDGTQTAQVELSQYRRNPVSNDITIGASGRFGKKQGFITAALVGSYAANLRKLTKR
jgi:hypothetical protein